MKRSGIKRNQAVVRVYTELVKPGPFTIAEVVEWADAQNLMPVPTIRDSQVIQDEWDDYLAAVEMRLRSNSTPAPTAGI